MNKREMLHTLIDRLLEVEETSKKQITFTYYSNIGADFRIKEGSGSDETIRNCVSVYTGGNWSITDQMLNAIKEIEIIKNIPDSEPKVKLTLTAEKARELGLIA